MIGTSATGVGDDSIDDGDSGGDDDEMIIMVILSIMTIIRECLILMGDGREV